MNIILPKEQIQDMYEKGKHKLTPQLDQIYSLLVFEEKTNEEVGEIVGLTPATVSALGYKAYYILRTNYTNDKPRRFRRRR